MVTHDTAPIRRSVVVRSDVGHTFAVFVRDIGLWWPTGTHSIGGDQVAAVRLEEHVGGRLYERWHDGTEHAWARVLRWEPPDVFALAWDLQQETEVELRFRSLGPALTRVDLEHRGWERLRKADVEGGIVRSYHAGWPQVLAAFTTRLGGAVETGAEPVPDGAR
jgi:hypothetical protein